MNEEILTKAELLKLKIELGICPRCGYKTNYNYFSKGYCCGYCAYPSGDLAKETNPK